MRTLLLLVQDGKPVHAVSVGEHPIQIGRAPANDLVLGDPSLSRRHASIWTRGKKVWLADHGSTNGTFVNDHAVKGAVEVGEKDAIRLGNGTQLRVKQLEEGEEQLGVDSGLVLLDVASGVRRSLRVGNNTLDGRTAVDVGPAGSSVVLTTGTRKRSLALELDFEVGDRTYRIERPNALEDTGPINDETSNAFAYKVAATLNGASGAEVQVERIAGGEPHLVSATPAVLLYILARKLEKDLEDGVRPSVAGWCSDDDIRVGIWGRDVDHSSNTLNVLLYRTRKELEKHGYHGGCIEKRRRATRLSVIEASTY